MDVGGCGLAQAARRSSGNRAVTLDGLDIAFSPWTEAHRTALNRLLKKAHLR
jgi:hypothetical protein